MTDTFREDNLRIVRFMGRTYLRDSDKVIFIRRHGTPLPKFEGRGGITYELKFRGTRLVSPDKLTYHKSWEWLMYVVVKVNKTYKNSIKNDKIRVIMDELRDGLMVGDIDKTYSAVIKYVKWYKTSKWLGWSRLPKTV